MFVLHVRRSAPFLCNSFMLSSEPFLGFNWFSVCDGRRRRQRRWRTPMKTWKTTTQDGAPCGFKTRALKKYTHVRHIIYTERYAFDDMLCVFFFGGRFPCSSSIRPWQTDKCSQKLNNSMESLSLSFLVDAICAHLCSGVSVLFTSSELGPA